MFSANLTTPAATSSSSTTSNLVDAEVEFDYDAELSDELTIRVGDVVKDVKRMSGGWWEGSLHGKRGLFPDNFVKVRCRTFFNFWDQCYITDFAVIQFTARF